MVSPQQPAILFCPFRAEARLSAFWPMSRVCAARFRTAPSSCSFREAELSLVLFFCASKASFISFISLSRLPDMVWKVSCALRESASSRCWSRRSVSAVISARMAEICCCSAASFAARRSSRDRSWARASLSRSAFSERVFTMSQVTRMAIMRRARAAGPTIRRISFILRQSNGRRRRRWSRPPAG